MTTITLDDAKKICEGAIAKASEIGIRIAVTVLDSSGNLLATHRMDGALVLAVEGSRGKAVASIMFGQPTGELEQRASRPTMQALMIQYGGRFILGQGAVPIHVAGEIVGSCGVGGGTPQEDEDCAVAGMESARITD